MSSKRLSDDNYAGSMCIQPVYKPRSRALLTGNQKVVRERICECSSLHLVRWMDQDAGGLVDDDDVFVLIHYVERKFLRRRRRKRERRSIDCDLVAHRKPLACKTLLTVYQDNAVSNHP